MTYEKLIDLLYEAYYSCRKNKSRTAPACQFYQEYELNLDILGNELINGIYYPSTSIVFGITIPKDREVFAANFRDRIVHHLLINKFMYIFESEMIDDSYNCRIGKGTLYGIKRLANEIKRISHNYTIPTYALCGDFEGFFMSINKAKLWQMIEYTLRDKYKEDDIEWWIRLLNIIVMHCPEQDCIIRSGKHILDRLPPNKSLLKGDGKHGLPIGNLPSQIFGNFYRTPFDKMMTDYLGKDGFYCAFVDDFRAISTDKRKLELLAPIARRYLKQYLELKMHPRKFCIIDVTKGVNFIGSIIKPWGTYIGNRTVDHALEVARLQDVDDIERHMHRLNSYFGFMRHNLSYAIRRNIYDEMPYKIKKQIVCINAKKFKLI